MGQDDTLLGGNDATAHDSFYEEAVREVEQIVTEIERGEMDIDQLTPKIKRAQELLALCQSQLKKVTDDVKKLLDHE